MFVYMSCIYMCVCGCLCIYTMYSYCIFLLYIYIYIYIKGILQPSKSGVGNNSVRTNKLFKF